MSNVIDIRPDRILREIRDHGSLPIACSKANVTASTLKELLEDYPKFAYSLAECMREFYEDRILRNQAEKYKTLDENYSAAKRALAVETIRLVKEARDAALS